MPVGIVHLALQEILELVFHLLNFLAAKAHLRQHVVDRLDAQLLCAQKAIAFVDGLVVLLPRHEDNGGSLFTAAAKHMFTSSDSKLN